VREGENVFVSFSRFVNREAYQQHESSLAGPSGAKQAALVTKAETLLLAPTARSLLR
jgi:hypothetical protein